MNITINSSSDYECVFTLNGSTAAIANALRRTMMTHVPMFAIDTISDIQNTSVMTTEQIINRLFYIPFVSTNIDEFNMNNECTCDKDCEKCSISFSVDITNTTNDILDVTSYDIKTNNDIVKPYDETEYPIVITKLVPGQVCIINGYIKKGIGQQHSKWSPVGTVAYKFMPSIKIDYKNMSQEDKEKLVKVCPMNVFSLSDKVLKKKKKMNATGDIEDILMDLGKCTYCYECVNVFPNKVTVEPNSETIVFTVESVGSLTVDTIIKKALLLLKNL